MRHGRYEEEELFGELVVASLVCGGSSRLLTMDVVDGDGGWAMCGVGLGENYVGLYLRVRQSILGKC